MKNKKLTLMLIAGFAALAIIVSGVAVLFSQLEKNPIDKDDTLVKQKNDTTLTFRDTEFRTGNFVSASDERLKDCVLLLDDQRGIKEIYPTKYAPLSGEVTTRYYYRNSGNIIYEKTTLAKSEYKRTAYSRVDFVLPEFKIENIKKINVCYGNYYDNTEGFAVDGVCDFFAATVDGDCPSFNLMKHGEISDEKGIRDFINEFTRTGSLKNHYDTYCDHSGRDTVFFQVIFTDDILPCSLLFTKEAINAQ